MQQLQGPVLAKPTRGFGGKGIELFANTAALLEFLRQTNPDASLEYIIQEFIPGYDVDCSVLCQEGKILAYTIQKGFLARSKAFSAPAGIDFLQDEQVFEVAANLMSALQWTGVAHIDMRYDERDQKVKILEINARYWISIIGSLIVGVNFPYLACLCALEQEFTWPNYTLGRYIAPASALKEWGKGFLGQTRAEFSFRQTGLQYILPDPLAESIKLLFR